MIIGSWPAAAHCTPNLVIRTAIVLGDYNPGGRLAHNWLRSVGQVFSPANPWYQYKWGSWVSNFLSRYVCVHIGAYHRENPT
jgi:hypothetical protein